MGAYEDFIANLTANQGGGAPMTGLSPTPPQQGFDLPGTLFGLGNIFGGIGEAQTGGRVKNPVPVMQAQYNQGQRDRIGAAVQAAQLKMAAQKMDLEKQKEDANQVESFMNILSKYDVSGEAATGIMKDWIKSNPTLSQRFGDHLDNFSLLPKTKEIERADYTAKPGELVDPVSQKPLPGGRYDVKGKFQGGQFIPTEIAPSKTAIQEAKDAAAQEKEDKRFGALLENQAAVGERFQQSQAATEKRFQESLSAQEKQRTFEKENALRKEFLDQNKQFSQVRDSYKRIQASADKPSPAGDMAMLYGYAKMLDPMTGVRPAEFENAKTARPLLERWGLSWDAVKSVWEGKQMTPGMRADFLNRSTQLYKTHEDSYNQSASEFRRTAIGSGLNPDKVIVDLSAGVKPSSANQPAQSKGPKVGAVEKGYRFKGGDPSKKDNWEKVQ